MSELLSVTRRLTLLAFVLAVPVIAFAYGWWGVIALAALLYGQFRRQRRWAAGGDSHGSAAFATPAQLARAGMVEADGLFLGRSLPGPPPTLQAAVRDLLTAPLCASPAVNDQLTAALAQKLWGGGRPLATPHGSFTHAVAFAGTGAGKTTALVLTNLLLWRGPIVCVPDVKGELYRTVAEHRARALGRRQVRLDPYHLCGPGGDTFNPLGCISPTSPTAPDEALALADALCPRQPEEREPHWRECAVGVVFAMMLLALAVGDPVDLHLVTVASAVAIPEYFKNALEAMRRSTAYDGALRRAGAALEHLIDRERASVLSATLRYLRFLNSPNAAAAVRSSSLHPDDLLTGEIDVYLLLPPAQMKANQGLLRYWLTGLFRGLCNRPPSEEQEILVLLDEAALLGDLPVIQEVVSLMRGWGIRCVFVYQSMGQLLDCFPNGQHQTFLSNMSTQIYFGINDVDTAQHVSTRLGQATVLTESTQAGGSVSRTRGETFSDPQQNQTQVSETWGITHAEHGRPLLTPDEVLGLPQRTMVVFNRLTPPFLAEQVRHYEPAFAALGRRRWHWRRWVQAAAIVLGGLLLLMAVRRPQPPPTPHPTPVGAFPDSPTPPFGGLPRGRPETR